MFKLLITLLTQLFFSRPQNIPAGMPPPDSSLFLPELDIAFMALMVMPNVVMPTTPKAARPQKRYAVSRHIQDDPTFSL